MAKHTPGPWRYEVATKTIRSVPANYWLASLDSWDGAVNHEANARLIAAAPDLLEALHDLLTRPTDPAVRERARKAVAKAEGRG